MIKMFNNMRITHKLWCNNGLLIALIVGCSAVGFWGMKSAQELMDEMYHEHFVAATKTAILKSDLNEVRAVLVTMMSQKDVEKQKKSDEAIKKLSKKIDVNIASMLNSGWPEDMVELINKIKKNWEAFRDTRDSELIPAIYAGDLVKAKGLALGVQAGRYKGFVETADFLLETEVAEGEENVKTYESKSAKFEGLLLLFLVIALALGFTMTQLIISLINKPLGKIIEISEEIAAGNLTVEKSDYVSKDGIGKLTDSTNTMLANLQDILHTISMSTDRIASASTELSAASEQMSINAETQASQSDNLAASSDEMATVILEVAKNSNTAAASSRSATEKACEGKEVIGQSQRVIATLAENSKKIGEVIVLIADIANKTDLLAINAAIEAANAGEQGKGFAVVADEVRKLAERTTKATREITDVIATIQGNTKQTIDAMEKAGTSMEDITDGVETTTRMIEQIAAATEEQSTTIDTFSETIRSISDSSKEVNSGTTETARASEELSTLSNELKQVVEKFRLNSRV